MQQMVWLEEKFEKSLASVTNKLQRLEEDNGLVRQDLRFLEASNQSVCQDLQKLKTGEFQDSEASDLHRMEEREQDRETDRATDYSLRTAFAPMQSPEVASKFTYGSVLRDNLDRASSMTAASIHADRHRMQAQGAASDAAQAAETGTKTCYYADGQSALQWSDARHASRLLALLPRR